MVLNENSATHSTSVSLKRRAEDERTNDQEFGTSGTKKTGPAGYREEDPINPNTQILIMADAGLKSLLPPLASADDGTGIRDLVCKMDVKYKRNPDLLQNHPDLSINMRPILLLWLMKVSEAYKLHRETLYLAMDYVDRYLTVEKNISRGYLQLVGMICLFLAAKFEERSPPSVATLIYLTAEAYTKVEILEMEETIVKKLSWTLVVVTTCNWLNIYLQHLSTLDTSSGTPGVTRFTGSNILLNPSMPM